MNPGKKKNPLSSDKSWQFPKEKALDTCLMRKKKKNGEENSSTCFWKPGCCPAKLNPKEDTYKSPIHSMLSHGLLGKRDRY